MCISFWYCCTYFCSKLVVLLLFCWYVLCSAYWSFLDSGVGLYLFSGIFCGNWYVLCRLVVFCCVLVCLVRSLVSRWFCIVFSVFDVIRVWVWISFREVIFCLVSNLFICVGDVKFYHLERCSPAPSSEVGWLWRRLMVSLCTVLPWRK